MSAQGGLTAQALIASLRRRRAALPPEIGTFVVFEACEAVPTEAPVLVAADQVWISAEGGVSLLSGAPAADEQQAARSLHALLTSVLLAARPGLSQGLLRLVEEGPSGGLWTLARMRDDLEAALVPLNRTASRRVLARLLREAAAERMRGDPTEVTPPTFNELDAELGDLLGEQAPAQEQEESLFQQDDEPTVREPVEEVLPADADAIVESASDSVDPTSRLVRTDWSGSERARPEPESRRRSRLRRGREAGASTDEVPPMRDRLREYGESIPPSSRRGLWLGLGLLLLTVLLAAVVSVLRPDIVARIQGEPAKPPPIDLPSKPKQQRAGDLVLEIEPARSQVLMLEGSAPLEVSHVPVGVAQEFVAMAEGREPSRALIAPDEQWESTDEGPYLELAMQTRRVEGRRAPGVGDSLLPRQAGEVRRRDGTVRVITTPRGAQVYRVVGFGPEAHLENLPVDRELELLIVRDGYEPSRLRIGPQDWPLSGPRAQLRESVVLRKRRRARRGRR